MISSFKSSLDERSPHDTLTFRSLSRLIDFSFLKKFNYFLKWILVFFKKMINATMTIFTRIKFGKLQLSTTHFNPIHLISIFYFLTLAQLAILRIKHHNRRLSFCHNVSGSQLHLLATSQSSSVNQHKMSDSEQTELKAGHPPAS